MADLNNNINDSPYTANPAANDFQETAVKNSKFTFSKGKKSEVQQQQEAEERKQREKHDEQTMIDQMHATNMAAEALAKVEQDNLRV